VQVYQCGPEPSFETCRPLTERGVEPGPDGSFSVEARVWHVIRTDGQEIDCLAPAGSCLVVAATRPWETLDPPWAAPATLPFDPDAPRCRGPSSQWRPPPSSTT
jgi:hypothetical protein